MGCCFAEFFKGSYLFTGTNDFELLDQIVKLRGSPSEENWSDFKKLPLPLEFDPPTLASDINKSVPNLTPDLALLIESMLNLDPKKRPSANELLTHSFFSDVKSAD